MWIKTSCTLFTKARMWKQPRCPSADEWIRKLWYTYTMEYYSAVKKNVFESVLMRWMKLEPIIQWSKSERKTPIQYINAYIWKKMVMMTLHARQQKRHRCKEQSFELCGRGRGWDDLREWHRNMYITICPLFFGFPSHLSHHRALSRVPLLYYRFSLVIYFIHIINSTYMSVLIS